MFGVRYLFPITGSKQATNSHIQSHRLIAGWQGFDSGVVHQQRHKPTSPRIQFNGDGRWLNATWQRTTPADGQCRFTLCQPHAAILPLEGGTGKLSRASISLLFEVGILGTLSKKVGKRLLQVPQSLLHWVAAHFRYEIANRPAFSTG